MPSAVNLRKMHPNLLGSILKNILCDAKEYWTPESHWLTAYVKFRMIPDISFMGFWREWSCHRSKQCFLANKTFCHRCSQWAHSGLLLQWNKFCLCYHFTGSSICVIQVLTENSDLDWITMLLRFFQQLEDRPRTTSKRLWVAFSSEEWQ